MTAVTDAATASIELGWLMGGMTVVFLATFAGWTWWAWRPANRANMEAAARIPLDDGVGP